MTPAEIAAKYGSAVVKIDFSWNLIYSPTGAQVFHMMFNNSLKLKGEDRCRSSPGVRRRFRRTSVSGTGPSSRI